jgi:hypothetical protein
MSDQPKEVPGSAFANMWRPKRLARELESIVNCVTTPGESSHAVMRACAAKLLEQAVEIAKLRGAKEALELTLSGVIRERDFLLAKLLEQKSEITSLRSALEWFADEGHYTDTYRRGAGFVDALGETKARAALLGMSDDDADAVVDAWSTRPR